MLGVLKSKKVNKIKIIIPIFIIPSLYFVYEICKKTVFKGTIERATWDSTLISFLNLIITGFIGYYAYQVADNQNASSETTYMIEILKHLAEDTNKYQEEAYSNYIKEDKGKAFDNMVKMISKILKAKEIILKINISKKELYYDIFHSFISTSVTDEVFDQDIFRGIMTNIPDETEITIIMKQYIECNELVRR